MEFFKAVRLLTCIIICELAASVGSFFTVPQINGWYRTLEKPTFNPPNWIFGPVWTVIFVLMGISLYLVWDKKWAVANKIRFGSRPATNEWAGKGLLGAWKKQHIILIFCVQLFLNVLWSFVFFALHKPGGAFIVLLALWLAILLTIGNFYRVSKTAAALLAPYILWVSFAAVLNYYILILN